MRHQSDPGISSALRQSHEEYGDDAEGSQISAAKAH